MGIEDDDIRKVREATDIVKLVTGYTQLRKVGRRWSGLCPFHNEKTGSFSVNAEEGLYYCFGCQKKGDSITFVREMEHLDFVGAVEHLANKAGIQLRYTTKNEGAERRKRTELTDAVQKAADWYHERLLKSPDAGSARGYLRSRGFDKEQVEQYQIGWAPDGWDHLARALRLTPKVFTDAGLGFVNRRGKLQDHFRGRVLFPIFDANNVAVGFGGRIMPGAEGPKYKNSSESAIYAKSRLLYGLNWAKDEVVRADEVIICEGYTDVIGFAQAGLGRAVATCGTALTEEHIRLLSRFAKRIVLAFDADSAGQNAAERIYEWEQSYEMDVSVVRMPDGVDPADLARSDPEALAAAVTDAQKFMAFRLGRVYSKADLETVEGRARAATHAMAVVREHPSDLVRDQYVMEVAGRTQVDPDRLRPMLTGPPPPPPEPVRQYRDDDYPGEEVADEHQAFVLDDNTETQVLRLAIHRPGEIPSYLNEQIFGHPLHRGAFAALLNAETLHEAIEASEGQISSVLGQLAVLDEPDGLGDRLIAQLLYDTARRELRSLQAAARSTDDRTIGDRIRGLQSLVPSVLEANFELAVAEKLVPWLPGARDGTHHQDGETERGSTSSAV